MSTRLSASLCFDFRFIIHLLEDPSFWWRFMKLTEPWHRALKIALHEFQLIIGLDLDVGKF